MDTKDEVTRLLNAARLDEPAAAAAELIGLLYKELRALAEARLRQLPPGQTLQPTALVHEAFLRLAGHETDWDGRAHFFGAAARAMREILIEHARRKASLKRGGDRRRVDASALVVAMEAPAEDMLALDEALGRLERDNPEGHELVMLRFFAGLTLEEAAAAMNVSLSTAKRKWRFVQTRLHRELAGEDAPRNGPTP